MLNGGGFSLYSVDTEKLLAVIEENGFTLTNFTRELGICAISFAYYLRQPERFPIDVIEKIEQVLGLLKTDTLADLELNSCVIRKTNISHKIWTK
jgi:HD-like signal output (HDOD) protein